MITLFRIEVRRVLSRRVVHAAGAVILLGMLVAGGILLARSHRISPERRQGLTQEAQALRAEDLAACRRGDFHIPADQLPPGESLETFCETIVSGPEVNDPEFRFVHYREVALGLSGLFLFMAFALGASFIGAEWHTGVVTTQLTWEPRRVRLLATKLAAAAAFAFGGFLATQVLLAGVVSPAALLRGTFEGVGPAWLADTAGVLLRGAAMAAAAAVAGASLASLARNTAAALAVTFVYVAILEPLVRAVRPRWQPWLLTDNAGSFVQGSPLGEALAGRSTLVAGAVVVAYLAALAAVALAVFRRRDVA